MDGERAPITTKCVPLQSNKGRDFSLGEVTPEVGSCEGECEILQQSQPSALEEQRRT